MGEAVGLSALAGWMSMETAIARDDGGNPLPSPAQKPQAERGWTPMAAPTRRTTIALLEPGPVVREGLRALFSREPDLELIAEAATLAQALAIEASPDVVVTEIQLRDARGATVVGRLRERFGAAAILVLTAIAGPREVEAAFAAGANGYGLKDSPARELVEAVRTLRRGEGYVEPSLGAALAQRLEPQDGQHPAAPLTPRERGVLRLLALGHTNAEIASQLAISLRTAEAHRASLMRKLGVRTRAELVRCAIDLGLLGPAA
jgi:two-component system response regulator NreC